MTRRTRSRRDHAGTPQTTPRHVWLAALGAVAVARREAQLRADVAFAAAARARQDARRAAADVRDVARGIAMTAEERLQPALSRVGAEFQARIATVLSRFGAGGSVCGSARASARHSGGARRKAAQRVARKGRG